jgi:hypothetical protein
MQNLALAHAGKESQCQRKARMVRHRGGQGLVIRLLKKAFLGAHVMLAICAGKAAYAQTWPDLLQQLVELSAQRLVIAEQVALAKWDRGVSVEDYR